MERGDVVFLTVPPPDPVHPTRVQAGARPAVILQELASTQSLQTIVVAPLTSRLKASRFPSAVVVQPTVNNGLNRTSVVLVHQITTVDKSIITSRIGELDPVDLERVELALVDFLGLPDPHRNPSGTGGARPPSA